MKKTLKDLGSEWSSGEEAQDEVTLTEVAGGDISVTCDKLSVTDSIMHSLGVTARDITAHHVHAKTQVDLCADSVWLTELYAYAITVKGLVAGLEKCRAKTLRVSSRLINIAACTASTIILEGPEHSQGNTWQVSFLGDVQEFYLHGCTLQGDVQVLVSAWIEHLILHHVACSVECQGIGTLDVRGVPSETTHIKSALRVKELRKLSEGTLEFLEIKVQNKAHLKWGCLKQGCLIIEPGAHLEAHAVQFGETEIRLRQGARADFLGCSFDRPVLVEQGATCFGSPRTEWDSKDPRLLALDLGHTGNRVSNLELPNGMVLNRGPLK